MRRCDCHKHICGRNISYRIVGVSVHFGNFDHWLRHCRYQSLDAVSHRAAYFRIDNLRMRRLYVGRYQGRPSASFRKGLRRPIEVAATPQCRNQNQSGRNPARRIATALRRCIHSHISVPHIGWNGCQYDVRSRFDDRIFVYGRMYRQCRSGIRFGRLDEQFRGNPGCIEVAGYDTDADGTFGDIRIYTVAVY